MAVRMNDSVRTSWDPKCSNSMYVIDTSGGLPLPPPPWLLRLLFADAMQFLSESMSVMAIAAESEKGLSPAPRPKLCTVVFTRMVWHSIITRTQHCQRAHKPEKLPLQKKVGAKTKQQKGGGWAPVKNSSAGRLRVVLLWLSVYTYLPQR